MPISDSFVENTYSRSSIEPILSLLRVNIDGSFYYYVNNNESITSTITGTSIVFQPAAFDITLPENNADSTPRAKLDFDPGDNSVVRRLRAADSRIMVTLWIIAANTPNVAESGPIEYESTDFTISSSGISIGLEIEPILDRIVPAQRFTPYLFPGLWENA